MTNVSTWPPSGPQRLAELAMDTATKTADEMLLMVGATPSEEHVLRVVKAMVGRYMEPALTDAYDAWEAGEGVMAEVIFTGHMKSAGIKAASLVMGIL